MLPVTAPHAVPHRWLWVRGTVPLHARAAHRCGEDNQADAQKQRHGRQGVKGVGICVERVGLHSIGFASEEWMARNRMIGRVHWKASQGRCPVIPSLLELASNPLGTL